MKYLVLLAAILFCTSAAATENSCSQTGCTSELSTLYTTANGVVYIGTPADETKVNCTPVSNTFLTLNMDHKNSKEIYASLLAAYMSGKKIQLRVNEGSDPCSLAYVRLDSAFQN